MSHSVNCQVCGSEHSDSELKTISLNNFGSVEICPVCFSKTADSYFKDASDLLNEIVIIAKSSSANPERRLREIKKLIGV